MGEAASAGGASKKDTARVVIDAFQASAQPRRAGRGAGQECDSSGSSTHCQAACCVPWLCVLTSALPWSGHTGPAFRHTQECRGRGPRVLTAPSHRAVVDQLTAARAMLLAFVYSWTGVMYGVFGGLVQAIQTLAPLLTSSQGLHKLCYGTSGGGGTWHTLGESTSSRTSLESRGA